MSDASRTRPRVSTREALRFLTEAGQTLAASLDYEATLQAVAELAVPRVACYCAVDILEVDGRVRRLGMAHVDPERVEVLRRTAALPSDPRCGSPLSPVLRSGEPVLVSPVSDDWLRETAWDETHLGLMRQLAPTSLILLPLIARGNVLGVLVLASTRTDRHYGQDDLALAGELARIAAVSIDNARLYQRAQDAVRARDEMLRVVSHDLRNPIGAVTMGASFLLEEAPEELRQGPFGRTLQTIRRSAERANRMIEDLLDVSRIEAGRLVVEPTPQPLVPLLDEAVEAHRHLAAERGIGLEWHPGDARPWAVVDRDRMLQVVGNLLGNALKFTPEGGRVEVGLESAGDEVRCWVADTGPGIPPEHLPHLFDRFWQASRTDRRGLGLGLAIAEGLVAAHGGRIWVESEVGVGSTFIFTLPAARDAGGATEDAAPP
ncbi:MAG TPA: GAF domain-containing sensor histidine kinase [Longimicrobiaceae bacterium]|nr:GAF domain-containing sensor histidine kinase [Longimicrobiaceae bacterium]